MLVRETLLRYALLSRIVLFTVQLLASHFDFSTDAFQSVPVDQGSLNYLDRIILRILNGFSKWDAVHMIHIAEYGYVLESSLAFFPLFPLLLRYITGVWATVLISLKIIHPLSAILLTATLLNLLCFLVSTLCIYNIVHLISKSKKQASIGTILFITNPASIFFSSSYTESLYSMLTFAGIYFILVTPKVFVNSLLTILCFSLAFATRSNGIVNLGYVVFYTFLELLICFRDNWIISKNIRKIFTSVFWAGLQIVFSVTFVMLPVYLHSENQRTNFCISKHEFPEVLKKLAVEEEVPHIGQHSLISWCSENSLPFPCFYSTIQTKYWDVGIFGYWQIRKIPCFLMATPALLLTFCGSYQYFSQIRSNLVAVLLTGGDLIPFCLHSVFLGLSALFLYNVEVFTRMIFSSTPFLYLFLARLISQDTPKAQLEDVMRPIAVPFLPYYCQKGRKQLLLVSYFFGYFIFGTALHAMGLPFT